MQSEIAQKGAIGVQDFEGTLVLEKLAEIGKADEFISAIDSDDFSLMVTLMKNAVPLPEKKHIDP